jgi:hypothetical protein
MEFFYNAARLAYLYWFAFPVAMIRIDTERKKSAPEDADLYVMGSR